MSWRTVPLKHLASIRISNIDKIARSGEIPVRLVNYTDVYYGDLIVPELELMAATATASQVKMFQLQRDDVLITKDSETPNDIGVPAYIERVSLDMVCGYHLAMLRPIPQRALGRFLYWAMSSKYVNDQLSLGATGITRYGLKVDVISQARIEVPSLSVQRTIVNYLDAQQRRVDRAIDGLKQQTNFLKERRQILIDAIITGEVTVPEMVE